MTQTSLWRHTANETCGNMCCLVLSPDGVCWNAECGALQRLCQNFTALIQIFPSLMWDVSPCLLALHTQIPETESPKQFSDIKFLKFHLKGGKLPPGPLRSLVSRLKGEWVSKGSIVLKEQINLMSVKCNNRRLTWSKHVVSLFLFLFCFYWAK